MSINEQIQKLEKEIVSPIVDHLMATEYAVAPPDPLVPERVWKERMRGELTTFLSGKEVVRRVDSASEILIHYIKAHLSQVEIQDLATEWELGVGRMNDLFEQKVE